MEDVVQQEAFKLAVKEKWKHAFRRLNGNEPGISGLMTFTRAWDLAQKFLWPRDISIGEYRNIGDTVELKQAFHIVANSKMLHLLTESFIHDLRKQFYLVRREVNAFMQEYETTADVEIIRKMIMRLSQWWKAWGPVPELGVVLHNTFNAEFQVQLYSTLPPIFSGAFKKLCQSTLGTEQDGELWVAFENIGLLERYENLVASVCYEEIEARVSETCVSVWGEQVLGGLRDWMAEYIVPWLILLYAREAKTADERRNVLSGVGSRFDYHVCKCVCELRISEIFDIIVDYPDSNPALTDLKECLGRVEMRNDLVAALRNANQKRLLHPGADTRDILTQYVSMIRCLRLVDPPGVLLHKVADPVRRYLRDRPDTIRSIVGSLVGEGGDLVDENEPPQPLQVHIEDYSDPNWEPDPIDAGPEFRVDKQSDIISTLVSIYDSKDLFVKELQVLLAQRLLAVQDGKYEKERRNIEILKIRFGEATLQVCEVMLRDMDESRRIDQHVQAQQESFLHPTIISKHFWPTMQTGKLKMPGQLQRALGSYAKEFTTFKPDKLLKFIPQMGSLDLAIELKNRTFEVTVPALEAAVIELFSSDTDGKDSWSLEELSTELGVDQSAVRQAAYTWIKHNILHENRPNNFILLEDAADLPVDTKPLTEPPAQSVVEEEGPVLSAVQQQEAEQMRVYWKFIEGMLTNLGAMPLDRIQTMLKLAPNYRRTIEQLAVFMETARREGFVTVSNGVWKLNK